MSLLSGSLNSSLEELMTQVDESFGHSSSFVEEMQEWGPRMKSLAGEYEMEPGFSVWQKKKI